MEFATKRRIINKVDIEPEEYEKYNIRNNLDTHEITWDSAKDIECPKEISLTEEEVQFIKGCCEALVNDDTPRPDSFWKFVERFYNS